MSQSLSTPTSSSSRYAMCACASSSWTMLMAVPKAFRLGASWAARKYAGALMSSVSADTVRMRLMPSRYVGDMCCRPSTSLPLLMRCSVASSVLSSTAMLVTSSYGLEVAAAALAPILTQQQLTPEQRDQLARVRLAEGTRDPCVIPSVARDLAVSSEIPRLAGSPRDDRLTG